MVRQARLEHVFLAIALAWGVAQVFIVPPLQVPDEGDHWFRAWALTDGQLVADRQGMITLPGEFARTVDLYTGLVSDSRSLPASLDGQPGFSGYQDLFDGPGSSGSLRVASRVANYGPVGYLPQAVGIGVGRLLGASPLACFYLARLANLLAAAALLFFAIRLAPFAKQLFVLFALLPMTVFELASVSCDALTISGALFFTALVLWASTRARLRGRDLVLIVLAAAALLNVKPGYEALVLLVLLIRPAQLGDRVRYMAFAAANVLVVVGVFLIVFVATATDARAGVLGGPETPLQFVVHDPLGFLGIVGSSLQNDLRILVIESIGVLGWLSIVLSPALYLFVLLVGLGLFVRMREELTLPAWRRGLLGAVGVAVFLTVAVALYVSLGPTGTGRVSFQGRYLAPVWLLLALSVYGIRFARRELGRVFLVGVLLVTMAWNLQTLISSYYP